MCVGLRLWWFMWVWHLFFFVKFDNVETERLEWIVVFFFDRLVINLGDNW
ncbi:hypothetical protein KC19_5G117200 [Ceratodon purpureus]|uniref:Uncharacterized protein n=1 Tax=Ceratodon purpureus TaxID=3225 RepID=A0A8T0I0E5_CERPU|nr:hypothetical protein KC19_5G117200 [Ceratodon purpureus]